MASSSFHQSLNRRLAFSPKMLRRISPVMKGREAIRPGVSKSQCGQSRVSVSRQVDGSRGDGMRIACLIILPRLRQPPALNQLIFREAGTIDAHRFQDPRAASERCSASWSLRVWPCCRCQFRASSATAPMAISQISWKSFLAARKLSHLVLRCRRDCRGPALNYARPFRFGICKYRELNPRHQRFAWSYANRAIEKHVRSTWLRPPVNCSATTSPIPAECLKPWPEHAETTNTLSRRG
jgi:hypothetical protein